MRRFVFLVFILLYSSIGFAAAEFPDPVKFPVPESYRPNVEFWMRVYGEWHDNQMVIHDARNIHLVLEVVDFPEDDLLRTAAKLNLSRRVAELRKALLELHENPKVCDQSDDHRKLCELYKGIYDPNKYRNASENIRVQQGIKDRFGTGLQKMTQYLDGIKKILREEGVPEEIAYLPLVESSFHNESVSRTRAAGIWQFMSGTARLYMKVNSDVDERLDPFVATRGAARYLRRSHDMFKNWPLAIMSYNHGQYGVSKAVKTVGSYDFMDILNNYDGRLFGFASRNFYAEFLAACKVMNDAEKYFGTVNAMNPLKFDSVKLSQSLYISALLNHSDLTREELRALNPALQSNVVYSRRPIPAGYNLHLPHGRYPDLVAFITGIRAKAAGSKLPVRVASSTPSASSSSQTYVVRKGDTLYSISRKFSTTVDSIRKLNGLSGSSIMPGQRLRVQSR